MSLEETRLLGIEFERRVQTMIPETEMVSKLDTETIYSYLNQYLDKFIHDLYKVIDNIQTPSKPSLYIETVLQGLLLKYNQNVVNHNNSFSVSLPDDFGLYVESYTNVGNSYRYKKANGRGRIPNALMSKTKAQELVQRPLDEMRIMRTPIAYLDKDRTITVFFDRYTQPTSFEMSYYKVPKYMNLFKDQPCELSMDVFDDLVTGAVDLYVLYVAGAEARKRLMQEQLKKNNKEDEQ